MFGGNRGGNKKGGAKSKKVIVYDPAQLADLLSKLSDQNTIKAAEKALKPFCNGSECIPRLLQQVSENPDNTSKLQAAILIKRNLTKHYSTYPDEAKRAVKSQILQIIQTEEARNVASNIVGTVSTILALSVKDEVVADPWDELFNTVFQMASSGDEVMCSRAYLLLQHVSFSRSLFLKLPLHLKSV